MEAATVAAEPEYSSCSSSDDSDAGDSEFVDAFPSIVYDLQDLPEFMNRFLWSMEMNVLKESKSEAIPVIPFKHEYCDEDDENRIYQRIMFLNLVKDRPILSDRFDRLFDDAGTRQMLTGHADVEWLTLDKKLLKAPRLSHRVARSRTNKTDGQNRKGNADNRQSFVMRHMFLVKQHVTPGAKTTGPEEFHLYQIYNVPIMLYQQISGQRAPDGSFYANTRRCYKAFLLNPQGNAAFFVRPGTTYISMSLQKTCYSVLRVTSSLFFELTSRCTLREAFTQENVFKPLPKLELDKLTVKAASVKRKRGRPPKSLDRLYWCPATTSTAVRKKRAKVEAVTTVTEDMDQLIIPDINEDQFREMMDDLTKNISMPTVDT